MAKTSATKAKATKAAATKAKPARKSTDKTAAAAATKADEQTGPLVTIEACKQWSGTWCWMSQLGPAAMKWYCYDATLCKQTISNSIYIFNIVFKTRAGKIQKYLAANGSNARVEINKEKPGRGNFVVRIEGKDEPILELLAMKRPFAALKELDMDDIGKSIMEALDE